MRGICLGLAALSWLSAFGTNLVRNAQFERVDAQGRAEAWQGWNSHWRADWSGLEDSHGAVFENNDSSHHSTLRQVVNVRPGRRYRFGALVKTENLRGKAVVCLEWCNKDGNYIDGRYTSGVWGTTDWVEQENVTPLIPADAAKVIIRTCCERGSVGRAVFDNVYVSEFGLIDGVYSSRYRNRAADGEVRFVAVLNDGTDDVRGYTAQFVFSDPGDTQTIRRVRAGITDRLASATCRMSDLAPGVNIVRFELNCGGTTCSDSIVFECVTPDEEASLAVRIDEHGRAIVDKKPFFPLGMYCQNIDDEMLRVYCEAPFNCILPYQPPSWREMDMCAAHGLKVIYSIKDMYSGADEKALADGAVIRRFRRHPALLAWYLNDERPIRERDALTRLRAFAELHDIDHPGLAVIYQRYDVCRYLPTFDVIGTDPYPLYRNPIKMVSEWTRSTRLGLLGLKPMWQVPQVFDKGAYAINRKTPEICRPPTYEDMRNMAWQCLVGGAKGLVFYSFFDLVAMDAKTPFRQRWKDVKRMVAEIKSHEAYLLSADEPPPVCGVPAGLVCRAWRIGGKVLFAAVNTTREPLAAKVVVGGRPVRVSLGSAEVKIEEMVE